MLVFHAGFGSYPRDQIWPWIFGPRPCGEAWRSGKLLMVDGSCVIFYFTSHLSSSWIRVVMLGPANLSREKSTWRRSVFTIRRILANVFSQNPFLESLTYFLWSPQDSQFGAEVPKLQRERDPPVWWMLNLPTGHGSDLDYDVKIMGVAVTL